MQQDESIELLLAQYKTDMQEELYAILGYWEKNVVDQTHGGFHGKIYNNNKIVATAPKGAVLNSRILWSFAAAYNHTGDEKFRVLAEYAYNYFIGHFVDDEYGGTFWTVSFDGKPLDTKKQTYAIAFAVYGLTEYYCCSADEKAKEKALQLYRVIREKTYDQIHGGYFEAFSREWGSMENIRLSEKDANEKKSMNTHLHVIEAFANLYKIWPDAMLKNAIEELLFLFDEHIINHTNGHLLLFFNESWDPKSDIVSYGHDIEAAWLLQKAAEIISHKLYIEKYKKLAVTMAAAAAEGLDSDGGLWYEYAPHNDTLIKQKHWWPQAEAQVGFFNAWEVSGKDSYLRSSLNSWRFIQKYILDKDAGEWYWGVEWDYTIMQYEDKAGLWKCPYHNSRACLEIIKRVDKN